MHVNARGMNATTKLLLPEDVAVAPVANLPSELSRRVSHESGDFYVTRAYTRSGSIIVDAQTAALLEHFRSPSTVVDAIVAFCRASELDPMRTLDDAFGTLTDLVAARVLVPADSSLAHPIASSLSVGQSVENVEILEAIHLLDDTEVYRGRFADGTVVALKIVGANIRRNTTATIHHEANILSRLDGKVTPRLLAVGRFDGRSFIVTTWHSGLDLYRAAVEARALPEPGRSDALLKIAEQVLRSYAHLHSQGAVHGDVHPRNVLVDESDRITILDFGVAVMPFAGIVGLHGGIDLFQAPEIAKANLASAEIPVSSIASEQYSIGALLYLLLTGGHTHSFSLQQDAMLSQVINEPPLPFSHHGADNFACLESCINRALAKDPADRHSSIDEMLQSFLQASERMRFGSLPIPIRNDFADNPPLKLLDDVLHRFRVPGRLYSEGLEAPTGSITYGAAGIAYFLLRVARSRDDETLLAAADQWLIRAASAISSTAAFWNAERGIVPEVLGQNSLFHHACGIHCVQALIAHARGDAVAQQHAVEAYCSASELCDKIDVAFGRSGLLIGCAMLLDIAPPHLECESLVALGQRLLQSIWTQLDIHPPLTENVTLTTLGAAHGWCGYLFATMRWCEASGTAVPPQLFERLEQLAALGQPSGRSMKWPIKIPDVASNGILSSSWCNGAAGYVHLWTSAFQLLGSDFGFERLARMAAWHSYDGLSDAPGDLCCGLAGRAYALLRLHRSTGELAWLERAKVLVNRAAASPGIPPNRLNSLFHGDIGIALLAADLAAPKFSCMPFFEDEHWPKRAASLAI
ncbi:lanthionine synthetase LanC family protein [Burkholderia pseudomallei]|uniref:lanthionine synthetase LanC family protein n=1 Tax=Burkholderia pseudomallei TaxID=28450 RepID=UPI0027E057E0|nr:lanthionine synthetase LanC family protein [Burkholderia pseudomallei]